MAFAMSLLGLGALWLVFLDNRHAARAQGAALEAPDAHAVRKSVMAPKHLDMILSAADATLDEAIQIGEKLAEQEIQARSKSSDKKIGPWTYNEALGSSAATLLDRAVLAAMGILDPGKQQIVCYLTATDSEGNLLTADAEYKITGEDFDARWWNIAAYNPEYLIPNKPNKYSISKSTIKMDETGAWEAYLTPTPREDENWIHSGGGDADLVLVLRLYNPSSKVVDQMGVVRLPEIRPAALSETETEGEGTDE
jgi:hypothetical protein